MSRGWSTRPRLARGCVPLLWRGRSGGLLHMADLSDHHVGDVIAGDLSYAKGVVDTHRHWYRKEDMTDKEIQQAVLRELDYEPQVRSTEIGVAVKDGIITLSGNVESYTNRYHPERAAKRVAGVKAIANDLEVHLPSSSERTDEDIARAAVRALEDRVSVPRDRDKVTGRDG